MAPYDYNRVPARPSAWQRALSTPPSPTQWLFLGGGALLGVIIGLIIGLIIGWGIWPVQWTNAWPADLAPEARAQYLAAVAEAYVYFGDEQAAQTARNRLFNLNEELTAAIEDAQNYFATADPAPANARVHISNLGQLAQGLGVLSPNIIVDTPATAAPADGSAIPTTPGETAAVGDSVRAWVNWTLTLLAAIVLVVGGFYIVGRLNQRRLAVTDTDTLDENDGFDEEEPSGPGFVRPVPAHGSNPQQRPVRGPLAEMPGLAATSTTRPRSTPVSRPETRGEEYGFEDEADDDALYARGATLDPLDYRSEDEIFDDAPRKGDLEPADDEDDEGREEHEDDDRRFAPRFSSARDLIPPDLTAAPDDDELPEAEENAPLTVESLLTPPPSPPARVSKGTPTPLRTLGSFALQYYAGIPDYDQSYSIMDPTTNRLIGDCGMGINIKNNIVQSNPDTVIALDVWLVDKKDEKSYAAQHRILLSEYVIDHKLEQTFSRDRNNDAAPIVPQVGLDFQLKGPNLVMDCKITEVVYSKGGPSTGAFQTLRVDLTLHARD